MAQLPKYGDKCGIHSCSSPLPRLAISRNLHLRGSTKERARCWWHISSAGFRCWPLKMPPVDGRPQMMSRVYPGALGLQSLRNQLKQLDRQLIHGRPTHLLNTASWPIWSTLMFNAFNSTQLKFRKISFLTLFKKPLTPPPPNSFEHYVVNFLKEF